MTRVDAKELVRMASLREIISEHVELKRQGRDYVGRCPFHAEKTPSFHVIEGKQFYHCFGCREHGDALDFLQKFHGWDFVRAKEFLQHRLAYTPAHAPEPKAAPPSPPPASQDDTAARVAKALEIWREGRGTACTDVETYLMGRGIDVAALGGVPESIRYHRALYHHETRAKYAAMVGGIQGPDGKLQGVHRTYLITARASEEPKAAAAMRAAGGEPPRGNVVVKARVAGAKKMLGVAAGGAVRLAPAGPVLAVAEGIETALSVMVATGLPTWAALSLGNLGGLTLPPVVREVVLCVDNDMKDPAAGDRQAELAAAAYREQGVRVRVARPPAGCDFNDVLVRGRAAVARALTGGAQ